MQREFWFERGLDRSQHDRQVFRLAACHDGVDGGFLHGASGQVRWDASDHFVGAPRGSLQHAQHADVRGRHDGQAVAPSALEAGFDRVVVVAVFDLARLDAGIAELDLQVFRKAGFHALRAAPGTVRGQSLSEVGDARHPAPFVDVPAFCTRRLGAVLEPDQGRNDFYSVLERLAELAVVHHAADALRKRGVVLRIDR